MLELRHVGFETDDNKEILRDVSLTVQDRFVAITGPNGGGKSTLAKVLCGICPPDGGRILLDGQCLVSKNTPYDRKLGLSIQMVYQQPYATLDPRQKIGSGFKELIRYHGFAPKGKERALTEDVLVKVGLEPQILAHLPHQISGGEAQRVAIARMLMQQAPIMVFDDSLSAVDAETDAKIRTALRDTLHSATVLLISHRVTTLMQADRILVLDGGRVSALGAHRELIDRPGIYRDIYDIQMRSDDRALVEEGGNA